MDTFEDAFVEAAMIRGESYRHRTEFRLKVMRQGCVNGLGALASAKDVNVG